MRKQALRYRIEHLIHLSLHIADLSGRLFSIHHNLALWTHVECEAYAVFSISKLAASKKKLLRTNS